VLFAQQTLFTEVLIMISRIQRLL